MLSIVPILALLPSDQLQIDPLLLIEAKEIWSLIGRADNSVWPGWDARRTPILIYFPGRQDVLINHPNPPAGFRRYNGPVKSPIGPIFIKDGPTLLEFDGQNTSIDVNGVQTLVVADTLSTRRQWVEGLIPSLTDKPDQASKTITDSLFPAPFDSMTMFAHEAFHAYQHKVAPKKYGDEQALLGYPALSVDNNVGFALESDFLAAALRAKTDAEAREDGIKWLAARQARRKLLAKASSDYEDGTEFNEGLAKYVEYRFLQRIEGRKPANEMWLVQGFQGYDNLADDRDRLIRKMAGYMTGKSVVNNDLYGASPVRFRLYYSGMAIGALLDRLGAKWQDRILKTDASLTTLAEEALKATPDELKKAQDAIAASPRYAELKRSKQQLADDGEIHVKEVLAGFEKAPGELILDYSKLEKPQVGFSFTPFGILRVDADRGIFRLIPIRGLIGALQFSEDSARPVLQDRKAKRIHFQLTATPSVQDGDIAKDRLDLPGVTLSNVKGRLRSEGKRVVIELAP